MTDDNKIIFQLSDRFPTKMPTWKILKLYLCIQHWVDLSGTYYYIFALFSVGFNFDRFSL